MSEFYKHRVGLQSKLRAMEHYVSKGYYVFDETNQGPIDFIAVNMDGDVKFIECKTVSRRKTGKYKGSKINRVLTKTQKKLNMNLFFADPPQIKVTDVDLETGEVL